MHFPEGLENTPFNLRSPGSYLARSYLIATVSEIQNVKFEFLMICFLS